MSPGSPLMNVSMFSYGVVCFQKKLLSWSLLYNALIPLLYSIFQRPYFGFFHLLILKQSMICSDLVPDKKIQGAQPHFGYMSAGVAVSSELQLKPGSQEIPGGLGIPTEKEACSLPTDYFSGSPKLHEIWKTNQKPLSRVTDESTIPYILASTVLCYQGFPLYFLLSFFLALRPL